MYKLEISSDGITWQFVSNYTNDISLDFVKELIKKYKFVRVVKIIRFNKGV